MYKRLKQNQRGAVSMITVIFVSILLTVITTSFIRLAINEQRESTDDDLTTRAFYAAESGVEDAITAIKAKNVQHANECTPSSGPGTGNLSADLATAYTCQLIDMTPTSYQAQLAENQSVFFVLDSGSDNIQSFTVSWHEYGDGGNGTDVIERSASSILPPKADWHDSSSPAVSYPAMMRLQVLEVPDSGVDRAAIEGGAKTVFLNPVNDVGSSTFTSLPDGSLVDAHCDTTGPPAPGTYICSMKITGLDDASNTYYLRLRSLYRESNVKVIAETSGGSVVALVNAQAVIDVTGKASDVYRRVEKRVSLQNTSLWPDFTILSAEDICKDFVITDSANGDPLDSDPNITDFSEANNAGIVGSCQNPTP